MPPSDLGGLIRNGKGNSEKEMGRAKKEGAPFAATEPLPKSWLSRREVVDFVSGDPQPNEAYREFGWGDFKSVRQGLVSSM